MKDFMPTKRHLSSFLYLGDTGGGLILIPLVSNVTKTRCMVKFFVVDGDGG